MHPKPGAPLPFSLSPNYNGERDFYLSRVVVEWAAGQGVGRGDRAVLLQGAVL